MCFSGDQILLITGSAPGVHQLRQIYQPIVAKEAGKTTSGGAKGMMLKRFGGNIRLFESWLYEPLFGTIFTGGLN
jgi:hypothetical protein